MDNMKKFYECDCTDNDHTIQVWTDPEFDEVIISTQLAPLHPWYKRVWVAVKYVFNPHGGNYSHWHDTILNPDSTRELRDQLDAFLAEQYNLKADALINEQLEWERIGNRIPTFDEIDLDNLTIEWKQPEWMKK